MQAVQHQRALGEAGALVAQHGARHCACTGDHPSDSQGTAKISVAVQANPVRDASRRGAGSGASPAPSSQTLQTGTTWSLPL